MREATAAPEKHDDVDARRSIAEQRRSPSAEPSRAAETLAAITPRLSFSAAAAAAAASAAALISMRAGPQGIHIVELRDEMERKGCSLAR